MTDTQNLPTSQDETQKTPPIQVIRNKESEGDTTPAEVTVPPAEVVPPEVTPPVETPPADATPPIDYKKKFSESTKRNQVVESQFKELEKVLGDITRQEVPSDDEMATQDPDWSLRSDYDKMQAKKLIVMERRQNALFLSLENGKKEGERIATLQESIANDPRLTGKETEFYDFATKPSNQGASLDVLVGAFLYDPDKDTVTPPVTPPVPPPSLERGNASGGMPPPETGKKVYTDEELQVLRTKDPKTYHDLIRRGII